jgi:hypothetical protein
MRPFYNALRTIQAPLLRPQVPIRTVKSNDIKTGPLGRLMGLKWICSENEDGSLTLYNEAAKKQLHISSHCVKLGCACAPPTPDSVQDYWVQLCMDPHRCRTIKGPIYVEYPHQ